MNQFEQEYYEDESWWENATLGSSNLTRIETTAELIPNTVKSLLDVGCGNGVFVNYLKDHGFQGKLVATDRSEEALKYVKTEKIAGSIDNLPFADRSFDCVSCLQVLEHIPYNLYEKSLSELARITSEYLLISVPFNEKIENNTTECPKCRTIFNVDLHVRSYPEHEFRDMFKAYGFELAESKNIIKSKELIGLKVYSNLKQLFVNRDNGKIFNSPICPLCGYKNDSFKAAYASASANQPAVTQASWKKNIINIWPKRTVPGYWIIGLFKKI